MELTNKIKVTFTNISHLTLGANNAPKGLVNFATTLASDAVDWRIAWALFNSITPQIFGTGKYIPVESTGDDKGTYSFSVSYSRLQRTRINGNKLEYFNGEWEDTLSKGQSWEVQFDPALILKLMKDTSFVEQLEADLANDDDE